jgi:hypothetical protein
MTCYYWEKNFTAKEKILWRVDPPTHERLDDAVRVWQVLVKELAPGSRLTVRTLDGGAVFAGVAGDNGTLRFALTFADRDGPEALSMQLKRPGNTEHRVPEMSVRQTLYGLRASLPVQGGVQGLKVTGSLREPQLAITTDRHASRWDVRNALAPVLLQATALSDGCGVPSADAAASVSYGNLMARHDPARQVVDLYEVAGRHTV